MLSAAFARAFAFQANFFFERQERQEVRREVEFPWSYESVTADAARSSWRVRFEHEPYAVGVAKFRVESDARPQ
jgi:hypothetical protein